MTPWSPDTYREDLDQLWHGTLRLEFVPEHPHGLVVEVVVGGDPPQGHRVHASLVLSNKNQKKTVSDNEGHKSNVGSQILLYFIRYRYPEI